MKLSPFLIHPGAKCRRSIRIFGPGVIVYTKQLSFPTLHAKMEDVYEELAPIQFTEAERRCAAVMCLVNNSGDITNREIQNATGISMKTIQRTRKTLEETKDPRGTIERKKTP